MALAETLNQPLDPFASVGKIAKGGDTTARASIARKELEPVMRAESTASQDIAKEETRFKREKAEAETLAEEQYAMNKSLAYKQYETGLPQRPTFNPAEFDAPAAAELAGLTAIVGAIAGAGSARAALKSMAGFTKGQKEGRADLYDREVKQFEQDLKAWKDNIGMAKEKLTQVIDLLSTDKNAALVKAKELDPLLQEGLALAKVRKGDYKGAMDVINSAIKTGDQLDIALTKTTKKTGLTPSATERDRYSMQYELLSLGSQIKEKLQDPKLKALVNKPKIRAGLFLQEESKLLDQLLQPGIPQDVRQLAILIKKYRNSVYRAESGLAVTAYEAMRQYGANPQPGSTAEVLLDQINVLNEVAKRSIKKSETIYPGLSEVGAALSGYSNVEQDARNIVEKKPQKASKADVEATAEANKISVEEAVERLKKRGFSIEGEE